MVLLVVIAFFSACNSGNNPKAVAEKFLTATNQCKFDEAKKYCTPETGKLLDMMSGFAAMAPDSIKNKKVDIKMLDEKIEGDVATVTYSDKAKDKPSTIKCKKVNGKWLVSMGKEDMQGKDDKKGAKDGAAGDSTKTGNDNSTAPEKDTTNKI